MVRITIRCEDRETRIKWRNLTNEIDDEANYEEVLKALLEYFDENDSRKDAVRQKIRGPKFR